MTCMCECGRRAIVLADGVLALCVLHFHQYLRIGVS